MRNKKVKIILNDNREINVELYENIAPISVSNFLNLVDRNYYDGVIFHRVIRDFMIQTGKYFIEGNALNTKEDIDSIKGEFSANGINNELKHTPGIISMARTSEMDSASSQFFICSATCPHLDGQYAAFGKVIDEDSLKVVLDISYVQTYDIGYGFSDFPIEPISIKTIIKID